MSAHLTLTYQTVTRWILVAVVALWCAGCPTYEDTYTGTYREVPEASGRTSDALEVDFFRFGDNAAAIVRLYKRDPITGDPFGEQQFCTWTSAAEFDEADGKFRLYINKSSTQLPRSQLFGEVRDDDTIEVSLFDERTHQPFDGIEDLRLERATSDPLTTCDMPEDFVANIEFPRDPQTGGLQSMPASAGYQIQNPVFAVSWLGVQEAGGRGAFAPVSRHVPAVPLDDGFGSNYDARSHALKNDRPVSIPPPPDIVRMQSEATTLALGHFVVVDDSPNDRPEGGTFDDWQFSWNTDAEKLVATSLQRATHIDCDDSGVNRWGRALLFVEDKLTDLSPLMQGQIDGIERCGKDIDCDRHFFVVDVCADDSLVREIELGPQAAGVPRIPMLVTDEYLYSDTIPLPRVNPFLP